MSEAPTRSWQVVGKEGFGEGRRSEAMAGVQPTGGGGGSVGGGIDARRRSFPPHTLFHSRFNGIQAQILPAILYLDVGQCETILQRPGHLGDLHSPQDFARNIFRPLYARNSRHDVRQLISRGRGVLSDGPFRWLVLLRQQCRCTVVEAADRVVVP